MLIMQVCPTDVKAEGPRPRADGMLDDAEVERLRIAVRETL